MRRLSALNVKYRDVRYTLPFLTQFWLFVTPVAYPSSLVPEVWRPFYGLNPMAGVVEGFRWALLGGPWPGPLLWVSAAAVVLRAGIQRRGIVVESAVHQLQRDLVRKFEIVLLIDGAAARIDIRGAAVGELDVLQSHGEGGRVLRRVGVDDAHDAAHAAAG